MICLRTEALHALQLTEPLAKAQRVLLLMPERGAIHAGLQLNAPVEHNIPGCPARPELVSPKDLPRRSAATREGHAAMIHAIAHIEFNAINLALDVVWRFANLPERFYTDWLQVAREEAKHFLLLNAHLTTLGYTYGDFAAHGSLWEMADKTKHDIVARLALVPRTLEARGLDASPPLRNKLAQMGDAKGAEIIDILLQDEIGHVAIGNHWYRHVCEQRGLDAVAIYSDLALKYKAPKLRGPFNLDARRAAGFEEAELKALQGSVYMHTTT